MSLEENVNINPEAETEPKKDHTVITLILLSVLSLSFNYLGIISILLVSAVCGVGLASSTSKAKLVAPIPGVFFAYLIARVIQVSHQSYVIAYLIGVVVGFVLYISLRNNNSASWQVFKLSLTFAVIFGLLGGLYIYSKFGSVSNAQDALSSVITNFLTQYKENLLTMDTTGTVEQMMGNVAFDKLADEMTVIIPGMFIFVCEALGWLVSIIARGFLSMYGRNDLFPKPRVIVLPVSSVILFVIAFFLTLSTSDMAYFVGQNLVIALVAPFFCVGITSFRANAMQKGKSSVLLIIAVVLALFLPMVLLYSVVAAGLISTVKNGIKIIVIKKK